MKLPDVMLANQDPAVSEVSVTIDGQCYRLTKHGRARYLQRVGPASDKEILERCVGDPRAIWAPDIVHGLRLVTYLACPKRCEPQSPATTS